MRSPPSLEDIRQFKQPVKRLQAPTLGHIANGGER